MFAQIHQYKNTTGATRKKYGEHCYIKTCIYVEKYSGEKNTGKVFLKETEI